MFLGKVIHGDGEGKQLGYPTANLDSHASDVNAESGVYAAYATLGRKRYKAAAVICEIPWKVEVYLLDYAGGDIYGSVIEVDLIQKVSEIERYDSAEELERKIGRDVDAIRPLLAHQQ